MSKNLNKINADNKYVTLTGRKSRPMHIPETSSITTLEGSLPQTDSTTVDDHTPISVIIAVTTSEIVKGGVVPCQAKYQNNPATAAAMEPPPLIKPMPKTEE